MNSRIRVGISEFHVARPPAILVTYGLGSCLGIVLFDRESGLGGLAHTLLPSLRPGIREVRMSKFVDTAIRLMVEELVLQGALREGIAAVIVGGANMFEPPGGVPANAIGTRNISAARDTLETLGIPLLTEDVGGNYGRTVEFDLASGQVTVRSVRTGDRIISI
jgi:chemotaxis protein CheD